MINQPRPFGLDRGIPRDYAPVAEDRPDRLISVMFWVAVAVLGAFWFPLGFLVGLYW